jgi:hypothetical protein
MILSIPKHISGVHEFPENKLFKRCLHGELPEDRNKPWLKPGSLSMKKLIGAIRGKKDCRLKDLPMMTEFQHTSINESINARQGWKKPGFLKKKTSPVGFLGFFWFFGGVLLVFFGFFCPEERG